MARLARAVAAGVPHHVTQRGNRRQPTFFGEADYALYRELLAEWCAQCGVAVWAWCLMPNHVHLVLVPETTDGLRRALGEAHRRYTRAVNARAGWTGHLWQGRFASFPLDGAHVLAAARYVERNPVRARLVDTPEAWAWSSAAAHLAGRDDGLVRVRPLLDAVPDWRAFLSGAGDGGGKARGADGGPHGGRSGGPSGADDEAAAEILRAHERTGRPLGSDGFVAGLEAALGRRLRPGVRGRKKAGAAPVAEVAGAAEMAPVRVEEPAPGIGEAALARTRQRRRERSTKR